MVMHTDVFLPGLPAALEGFTIAHLSDLHFGSCLPPGRLERLARMTNQLGVNPGGAEIHHCRGHPPG